MAIELDRREFVKIAGAAGVAAAATGWDAALSGQTSAAPGPDAAERDLVLLALDAVRAAGASYADARIMHGLIETVATREQQITGAGKAEISTRIRLAGTQKIMAIAQLSDGSCWSDTAEVVVTT